MVRIYAEKTKQTTIALVQAGSFIVAIAEASGIHERTIRKWPAAEKERGPLTAARPGPKPPPKALSSTSTAGSWDGNSSVVLLAVLISCMGGCIAM
ncbi:hypothetical protein PF011_g6721 [Phytophthora fragariae]|uniref:Uncharacterized protein n=1 Tax=Phytophthora fragariae TaxID=53985 RepID=A0A6A3LNM7_9STRA|nr:hypothetical protein PF011_g6721 [Phytophthora fragariae]